jgi:V8-like Glu-specific endopeptidase
MGEKIYIVGYQQESNKKKVYLEAQLIATKCKIKTVMLEYKLAVTNKGLTGAPIYLKRNKKQVLVGIHIGYDKINKVGKGIGITSEIVDWIELRMRMQFPDISSLFIIDIK